MMRVTASLREDTPSFRYMEIASDFTVCREMWSRFPISAMESGERVEVHADGLSRVVLSSNFIQTG
jgi:hypothetical protein